MRSDLDAQMKRRPLFGRRILVTRTQGFAGPLMAALRDAGAEPISIPLTRIEAPGSWDVLDRALRNLESYDALLLTNQNAARGVFARAKELGVAPGEAGLRALCLGQALTKMALEQWMPTHAIPSTSFGAESMLSAIRAQVELEGMRLLLPAAEQGNTQLSEGLIEAGAVVDAVASFRTTPAEEAGEALCAGIEAGGFDVLTFASPSAVRDFCSLVPDALRAEAAKACIGAVGPLTARTLHEHGLDPQVVSPTTDPEDFVRALEVALGPRVGSA